MGEEEDGASLSLSSAIVSAVEQFMQAVSAIVADVTSDAEAYDPDLIPLLEALFDALDVKLYQVGLHIMGLEASGKEEVADDVADVASYAGGL